MPEIKSCKGGAMRTLFLYFLGGRVSLRTAIGFGLEAYVFFFKYGNLEKYFDRTVVVESGWTATTTSFWR